MAEGHSPELFRTVREQAAYLLGGLQNLLSAPREMVDWLELTARTDRSLRREITALRAERLVNEVRLQRLSELQAENARLRGVLDSSVVTTGRMLLAEVLRADANPDRLVLVLDKGLKDGVTVGMPVLDALGIMGQIVVASDRDSQLMLITDRRHGIAVRSARSGARGILQGIGDHGDLMLDFVPESADIQPGDLLVSSGLGARYPAGYPVATVSRVMRSGGGEFAVVHARPVAGTGQSRHVVLLFPEPFAPAKDVLPAEADNRQELPDATP